MTRRLSTGVDGSAPIGWKATALVLVAFLGLAFASTLPFGIDLEDRLPNNADGVYCAWAIGWLCHQLPHDPRAALQANLFFPDSSALLYGDPMLAIGAQALPLCAAGVGPVAAYNVTYIVTIALAGFFAFLLAREITGHTVASFLAGEIFALTTANYDSAARLQIVSSHWTPLTLFFLTRALRSGRVRDGVGAGLAFAAQALACVYYELYLGLLLALTAPLWLLAGRKAAPGVKPWRAVAALALIASVIVLPFNLVQRAHLEPLSTDRLAAQTIGAHSFYQTLASNWIYGRWLGRPGVSYDDTYFPGALPILLAAGAFAMSLGRRGRSNVVSKDPGRHFLIPLVAVGLLAFVFSLGTRISTPWGPMPGPLSAFASVVPGLAQTRVPSRFLMFGRLGLAVAAAGGVAALARLARPSIAMRAATAGLAVLLPLEHLSIPLPSWRVPRRSEMPKVNAWLSSLPAGTPIVEFPPNPVRLRRAESLWLHTSAAHWLPMVNGYNSFYPVWYDFVYDALLDLPDEVGFTVLEELGVDTLVFHPTPPGTPEGDRAVRRFARYASSRGPRVSLVASFDDSPRLEGLWSVLGGERVYRVNRERSQQFVSALARHLQPVPRSGWRCEAKPREGSCGRALDGDPQTYFDSGDTQRAGDFFRVQFPREVEIGGFGLETGANSQFYPRGLEVRLLKGDEWTRVEARLDVAGFVREMLRSPRAATMRYSIDATRASGLELGLAPPPHAFNEWRLPEMHVYH